MKHLVKSSSAFRSVGILAAFFMLILYPELANADSGDRNIVEFTYAGDPGGASGYSAPHYKGGSMMLTEDLTRRFNRCQIIEVEIANGTFNCDSKQAPIDIFFTSDLNSTPFYIMSGEMDIDKPKEYKSYPLNEPVTISEGIPMYVGFVVKDNGACEPHGDVNYPVWTDGNLHTDKPGGYRFL